MTSFKSGSGNLDFGDGGSDSSDRSDEDEESATDFTERDSDSGQTKNRKDSDSSGPETEGRSSAEKPPEEYPYFIRRSNVSDERNRRIEIHLREQVHSQESEFRQELATHLDVDDVSKTDAREFALIHAFRNPEAVAELMAEEGYGVFD
ncbi:acyl-CoA dehydrogenase [Natrarchaeobius chitinivorans]|uniref:Acyl-CoA dehydrogenase n=1 Tax=Natrarchaeobius chitinivorans TaxID=1679083 RepID=A0A3N6LW66_NATCH|nr:acyl-CoA dehydrogenase [Natrarchaeobius chitinivorans]RQG94823.1 acyl-CoA dehydrogenase [Natrarchaeobius chitinivorans]